jgi:hypothetical protein
MRIHHHDNYQNKNRGTVTSSHYISDHQLPPILPNLPLTLAQVGVAFFKLERHQLGKKVTKLGQTSHPISCRPMCELLIHRPTYKLSIVL